MKLKINHYTFIIIFIFLFLPVYKFILIEPYLIWKIDKQNIGGSMLDEFYKNKVYENLKKKYYINNNSLCFFANNSRIISQNKLRKNIICSSGTGEEGLLLYSNTGDKISFLNKNKSVTWKYKTHSYPFQKLNNDLILLITGENAGYGTLNTDGEVISEPISSGMLLTSFDIPSKTNLIIMGYANGNIKLFNEKLKELWYKKFLKSNIQIVKKVTASSHGSYYAALTGLEPEYLSIMDKYGTTKWSRETLEARRRPADLKFSGNEKFLLEESEQGFRLYSVKRKKIVLNKIIHPAGPRRSMISMDISYDGAYIIVSYKINKDVAIVELFDNEGHSFFRLFYENELPFVAFSFKGYNFQVEIKNKVHLYGI